MGRYSILFVDDEESLLDLRRLLFEHLGYCVLVSNSGYRALQLLASVTVDLVVIDYLMPEMDGEETAKRIRAAWPTVPIILSSGCLSVPDRICALVDASVSKGDEPDMLIRAVEEQIRIVQNGCRKVADAA